MRSRARYWWAVLRGVYAQINRANLSLIAAGVAFFGMLSLFPALSAIVALWGVVSDPDVVAAQLVLMQDIVPDEVFALISAQVTGLAAAETTVLSWAGGLSLLLAVWSARAGVGALVSGLNAVYGVPQRGGLRHLLTALSLTGLLVGVALVALSTVVIAPVALKFLPLGTFTALLAEIMRWTIAIGVMLAGLGIVYRYGPNLGGPRTPWLSPGAVLAVFVWVAASAAFSIYLANFGNYNEIYGSIGAAIALLMWLYLSAFLILVGAAINVELSRVAAA